MYPDKKNGNPASQLPFRQFLPRGTTIDQGETATDT
jgi:hypothetical protein